MRDDGAGVGLELTEPFLNEKWSEQVVRARVAPKFSSGQFKQRKRGLAHSPILLPGPNPKSRITAKRGQYLQGIIGGRVVGNQHFEVLVGLRLDRLTKLLQISASVIGSDQKAD